MPGKPALGERDQAQCLAGTSLLNALDIPMRRHSYCSHFASEADEAQRGKGTYPRSHSFSVEELGFEPAPYPPCPLAVMAVTKPSLGSGRHLDSPWAFMASLD